MFVDYLLIFKIEKSRVVENVFPEKINHDQENIVLSIF